MTSPESRQQRKLAYYRALDRREPAFGPSLAALCRRLDAILAPYGRNAVRWELLDATHGGAPADQIAAFRAIVVDCDQAASTADPAEAARWREQAELPRRFADVLETVDEYRRRWQLPDDAVVDVIGAYLSGEERLISPERPATPRPQPFITIPPPPPELFLDDAPVAGALIGPVPPGWVIPYDPTPPAADGRPELAERLERLFAYVREHAYAEAARLEAALAQPTEPGDDGSPLIRDAAQLYGALFHAESPLVGPNADPATADTVRAWAEDLGISLP